jgi:hypothetical protein
MAQPAFISQCSLLILSESLNSRCQKQNTVMLKNWLTLLLKFLARMFLLSCLFVYYVVFGTHENCLGETCCVFLTCACYSDQTKIIRFLWREYSLLVSIHVLLLSCYLCVFSIFYRSCAILHLNKTDEYLSNHKTIQGSAEDFNINMKSLFVHNKSI